jgi:hypothetical protein
VRSSYRSVEDSLRSIERSLMLGDGSLKSVNHFLTSWNDSLQFSECELVGGTRMSEHKPSTRKTNGNA